MSIFTDKFDALPEFLSPHDLVALGLYPSTDAAHLARVRGPSPSYIKIGRKVLYLKSNLIAFVNQHLSSAPTPRPHSSSQEPLS